jgi:hypothetical protein
VQNLLTFDPFVHLVLAVREILLEDQNGHKDHQILETYGLVGHILDVAIDLNGFLAAQVDIVYAEHPNIHVHLGCETDGKLKQCLLVGYLVSDFLFLAASNFDPITNKIECLPLICLEK